MEFIFFIVLIQFFAKATQASNKGWSKTSTKTTILSATENSDFRGFNSETRGERDIYENETQKKIMKNEN